MRVGIVILPEHRWQEAAPKWQAAEEYGFAHAWTYDHIGWRSLVGGPWFSVMPTLTAAATVTSRIALGTLVASPHFRHPVPFAREVLAVDDISGGRFVLGIGAGTVNPGAYDIRVRAASPLSAREQFARYAEFVELTDALLRADDVTWHGRYYSAVGARNVPGCVQQPRVPFVLAGNGPKALRLAARFGDGWITTGPPTESLSQWWSGVAELSSRFTEAAATEGREPAEVRRYLSLDASPAYSLSNVDTFTDAVGRAAELGFTDVVVHWPRPTGIYAGSESLLDTLAADVLPGLPQG